MFLVGCNCYQRRVIQPYVVPIGDPSVSMASVATTLHGNCGSVGVSEPSGFCLLHVYEYAEAAASLLDVVQQTWRFSRRKYDVVVVSILSMHCGV